MHRPDQGPASGVFLRRAAAGRFSIKNGREAARGRRKERRDDAAMNITAKRRLRYLSAFAALLLIEVLIALFVHDAFVRPFIGDVLVVAVLYCLVRIIKSDGWRFLPVVLFLFATGVEFLQALGFVPLLGLENSRFWRTILGSTFDPADILCYAAGSAMLMGFEGIFRRLFRRTPR
mgnify:FL=1